MAELGGTTGGDGDDFLGSTLLFVGFRNDRNGSSGLNDRGQVAFEFNLSDGNGIAIWAIPEPTSLALSVLGVVTLMTRRRRGVHRR